MSFSLPLHLLPFFAHFPSPSLNPSLIPPSSFPPPSLSPPSILPTPLPPENPAIAPENDYIEAMAGGQIELKVFVSSATGPIPESQITWREPNGNVLEDDQAGVEIHTTGRRLILSGLTTSHSGTYNCTAILSIALLRHASTTIELSVFGECCK